jgi:hypothetical protein
MFFNLVEQSYLIADVLDISTSERDEKGLEENLSEKASIDQKSVSSSPSAHSAQLA